MIEYVPASPAHIGTIAARMREIDRLECSIMGHSPKQALRVGLRCSTVAYTAKVDGRPEAMFGVASVSLVGGEGSPWLLLTDDGARNAKALLREGRRYSDLLQCVFPILSNYVHADNDAAIRWLKRLGYGIGPVKSRNGHPMREFERRKGQSCVNSLAC